MNRTKYAIGFVGRTLFVIVIFVILFAYAMFQGGKVSWTVFYILAPFLLYAIAFACYPMSDLRIQRVLPTGDRVAGEDVTITLKFERKIPFPLLYTVVKDSWSGEERGTDIRYFGVFGFRKKWEHEYTLEALQRGEYIATELSIEVIDFFSWIKKTRIYQQQSTFLVFPKTIWAHLPHISSSYEQGGMASPLRLLKDTSMVSGVRDYQAGDRFSWIHWKSFARTNKLMTKEFEDRQTQEMTLMLDPRPSEAFEELVSYTATLLKEAASEQADIRFLSSTAGSASYVPSRSSVDLRAAYIYLAKLQPAKDSLLKMQVKQLQKISGSIVLVTSQPDAVLLQPFLSVFPSTSISCLVPNREKPTQTLTEAIRFAKSKGVQVYTIFENE